MTPARAASHIDRTAALALLLGLAALALPLGGAHWTGDGAALALWLAALASAAILARPPHPDPLHPPRWRGSDGAKANAAGPIGLRLAGATFGAACGAVALYRLVLAGATGGAALALWAGALALSLLLWRALERSAALAAATRHPAIALAAPLLLGLWTLYLWQLLTVGFAVPPVLLPPPSLIGAAIAGSLPVLGVDFVQTVLRSMIPGYLIGCGAGLLVGILVDRLPFLQRGLLPVGNLAGALPIVGIAPIMVMWFGFDWQSKAAVVVVMTFFPMLVNTIAGLAALGRIECDLMRTWAASYGQTLRLARLPAALPFIFNGLKINSTLALIGAIVAEFFGTPIYGMGFRISTAVGRLDIPLVWATVAVAALTGSAAYGALALAERSLTFWHPSLRKVR